MFGNFCDGAFWDINKTWYADVPEFSPCFEDIIISSSPSILFCGILLLNICLLPLTKPRISLPWTWLNVTKLCLSVFLVIITCTWCGVSFYESFSERNVPISSLVASSCRAALFIFVTILLLMHRYHGVITSDLLSALWIVLTVFDAVLYRSVFLKFSVWDSHTTSQIVLIMNLIYYPIVLAQLLLSVFSDKKNFGTLQQEKVMDEIPLLVLLSYGWFTDIIYKSRKKILSVGDLRFENVQQTAEYIYGEFSKRWKYYLLPKQLKNPSLAWTLITSFKRSMLLALILEYCSVFLQILPSLLLDRIIDFVKDDTYAWRGYFFAALIFSTDFVGKLFSNMSMHYLCSSIVELQVSLMSAVFRKNLIISTTSRKDYDSGALMNLLSVDIKRVQWFVFQLVGLSSSPIRICLIIYVMWQYLGIATLAGVGVILVLFPISYVVSRCGEKFSDRQMKIKDVRIKHMNEILGGIKILKLYAWEMPFADKVFTSRKEEVKWLSFMLYSYVVTAFVYFCVPFLVSTATFGTYLLMDSKHVLDPTRAFVSLSLMEQLRYALFQLPDAISDFMQFNISLGRLRKFFNVGNTDVSIVGSEPDEGEVLTVRNASFEWTSDWGLRNISLSVPKGKLIAVIGPVGAGKSSLLSAVLGEMSKTGGSVDIKGSIAYVPQQPWVQNRILRDNILLVKPMNEDKYNKILDLCCLRPDLEILPAGDMTEIGEKGVNISGGQKLRVNLAQAVYQDRDTYLLDDPLSAVDVHVRKALFKDIIGNTGILKDKTRVLVTHDVSILRDVDLVVCMKDGCIDEIGTYEELQKRGGSFSSFIEEHIVVKKPVEEKKPLVIKRILSRSISRDSIASSKSLVSRSSSGCGDPNSLLINEIPEEKEDIQVKTHQLIDDEHMEIGGVHRMIYWSYVKRMGLFLFFTGVVFYIIYSALQAGGNFWVTAWSSDPVYNGTEGASNTYWRLSIYSAFGVAQAVTIAISKLILVFGAARVSTIYHKDMLESVLKSPLSFFESTPIGRIINRFTTDLDILDVQVFFRIEAWIDCLFSSICAFIIIGINTPIFLAVALPLCILYYVFQALHLNAFRQMKRLESTTRSPLYSLFMESIQGVSSISAYKIQKDFIEKFEEKLDSSFVCTINSMYSNRWLSFNLDTLGSLIVLVATLLAINNRDILSPAIVGLIITYALTITDSLKWLVRMNSELEDKSISIERIDEFCHLKPEASWDLRHVELSDNWPSEGNIEFSNYSTRYREDLDLVLKDINLIINSKEKVGIVGRTGAGKSSFTLALFRIIEPVSGTVFIDGVDITKIGLHDVRANLTIIPQDPVLFTGTLRMNLDPNDQYSDLEIWNTLEKSYLKTYVSNLSLGLSYELEEGGSNLSAGLRQLVCLARALLKNTKILILDEATASVDVDTDSLIQKTIRTAFADSTVITIAHRINTVLDYDKIVVMESGSVMEVGKPKDLLTNPESKFTVMCKEAGLV